jgi:hypothetical protein
MEPGYSAAAKVSLNKSTPEDSMGLPDFSVNQLVMVEKNLKFLMILKHIEKF